MQEGVTIAACCLLYLRFGSLDACFIAIIVAGFLYSPAPSLVDAIIGVRLILE